MTDNDIRVRWNVLDLDTRVAMVTVTDAEFDAVGETIDISETRATCPESTDVVLVVVPAGEGVTVQHAIQQMLGVGVQSS